MSVVVSIKHSLKTNKRIYAIARKYNGKVEIEKMSNEKCHRECKHISRVNECGMVWNERANSGAFFQW